MNVRDWLGIAGFMVLSLVLALGFQNCGDIRIKGQGREVLPEVIAPDRGTPKTGGGLDETPVCNWSFEPTRDVLSVSSAGEPNCRYHQRLNDKSTAAFGCDPAVNGSCKEYFCPERSESIYPWRNFVVAHVGNEFVVFQREGDAFTRKGETWLGFSGDVHEPMNHIREDYFALRDDFQFMYGVATDSLFVIDGSSFSTSSEVSKAVDAQTGFVNQNPKDVRGFLLASCPAGYSQGLCVPSGSTREKGLQVNNKTTIRGMGSHVLSKIEDKMILTTQNVGGSGDAMYVVFDPTNPTILGDDQNTWPGVISGSPYKLIPSEISNVMPLIYTGSVHPLTDSLALANVMGPDRRIRRKIVDLSDVDMAGTAITLEVDGQDLNCDILDFTVYEGVLWGACLKRSPNRLLIFQVDLGSGALKKIGDWVNPPATLLGFDGAPNTFNPTGLRFTMGTGEIILWDMQTRGMLIYELFYDKSPEIRDGFDQFLMQVYQTFSSVYAPAQLMMSGRTIFVSGSGLTHMIRCD